MGFKRPEVRIFSLGPGKVLKSKDFGTFLFYLSLEVQTSGFDELVQNKAEQKLLYQTGQVLWCFTYGLTDEERNTIVRSQCSETLFKGTSNTRVIDVSAVVFIVHQAQRTEVNLFDSKRHPACCRILPGKRGAVQLSLSAQSWVLKKETKNVPYGSACSAWAAALIVSAIGTWEYSPGSGNGRDCI